MNAASAAATAPEQPRRARLPGLDAARALAVVAMVVGHTAHALLTADARALPWIQTYWSFRGLTAPLFLFVSGWAVMSSVERSGLSGTALLRARIGRVGLLLVLAMLLRWPGWNVRGVFTGEVEVWRHLVGYDALHCIGISLLLGILVLSTVRTRRARMAVLGAIAVAVPVITVPTVAALQTMDLHWLLQATLIADARSPFALLPWTAYFFAGAFVGVTLSYLDRQWTKALALVFGGVALAAGAWALGPSALPPGSPVLFSWRLGQVLLLIAGAMVVPLSWARICAPIGRSTLVIYVAHLPIVYGWSTVAGLAGRWGRTLQPLQAFATAAVVLAVCFALAVLLRWGTRFVEQLMSRRAARATAAVSPATGESPPS